MSDFKVYRSGAARAFLAASLVAALGAGCGDDETPRTTTTGGEDAGANNASPDAVADVTNGDTESPMDADGDDVDVVEDVVEDTPPEPFCGDGACNGDETIESCVVDCDPAPVYLYDPEQGLTLTTFPDDFYTVPAPTETGLQVDIGPNRLAYVNTLPLGFQDVFHDLSTLDGFGVTAGGFLSFTRPLDPSTVPSGPQTVNPGSSVFCGYIENDTFVPMPVETLLTDADATVIFRPMRPFPSATRAVCGVTTAVTGADGVASKPNPILEALLAGTATGDLAPLNARYDEALAALSGAGFLEGDASLAALTVFTTQTTSLESVRIAENIRGRAHSVGTTEGCEDTPTHRLCTITFEAGHYRDEARVLSVVGESYDPPSTYTMKANVYLPLEPGEFGQPYPVIIYGHGLSGEREQARRLAQFAAPLGIATVSIDAAEHGDHPVVSIPGGSVLGVAGFFGLENGGVNANALRDNWRQSTYDKLALIEVIKSGADVDGDDTVDLRTDNLTYLGVSLGGIMGVELLALSADIEAGVLIVPGGRVSDILQFSEMFSGLVSLLTPAGVTDGDVARFWPLIQTAIDRGDAGSYAPHVVKDRLVGEPPDVLVGMVIDDTIVPEPANLFLARSLDIPQIAPVIRPVELVPVIDAADLPLSANLDNGRTGGTLQYDWVRDDSGDWEMATHNNIGDSDVGAEAWFRFLEAYLQTGNGEIVDAYETLGLERPEVAE